MDVLASVVSFGAVLGALAFGLITIQRQHAKQELQPVRIRGSRGHRR